MAQGGFPDNLCIKMSSNFRHRNWRLATDKDTERHEKHERYKRRRIPSCCSFASSMLTLDLDLYESATESSCST